MESARILQILLAADWTEKGSFSISLSTSASAIPLACSSDIPPSITDCSSLGSISAKFPVIMSKSDSPVIGGRVTSETSNAT